MLGLMRNVAKHIIRASGLETLVCLLYAGIMQHLMNKVLGPEKKIEHQRKTSKSGFNHFY